ncbi:hypothetical protein C8F04DRAFT_1066592 [Mycena alexandri]|uniref:Uncharacterized protein n=1 Tax=Mycena alexandri TaxID=1745969 RepID=A0AAD6TGZ2_9AGAR|nr:hypothetical protein C8F04DRAFT_1066592 [Mycena alexandri]
MTATLSLARWPTMSQGPRFPRARPMPKPYTEPQLNFLKSYLPEFERRSLGPIRGDAKKFALERAADFIARFGLPEEDAEGDTASRFKEQLYNWFKNTVGRNRRRVEGSRPRSAKKTAEKTLAPDSSSQRDSWDHHEDYSHAESSSSRTYSPPTVTPSPTVPARIPLQYSLPSTLANALQPSPSPPPVPPPPAHITVTSLRDAFLNNLDAPLLGSQIHSFVLANPSPLALKPVVLALFQAISAEWDKTRTPPNSFLTRYLGAAHYFPSAVTHAGSSGPVAGARALQMQIRKSAKWMPSSPASAASSSSMSHELHRITLDRARRKEHIQWARIHAAALEVGVFTFGYERDASYSYGESRVFSDLVANDALWEDDEVEWVAGVFVLHALIRTSTRNPAQKRVYETLLANYEGRWKEMKDETRQAMVTEALLAAKADLARLGP